LVKAFKRYKQNYALAPAFLDHPVFRALGDLSYLMTCCRISVTATILMSSPWSTQSTSVSRSLRTPATPLVPFRCWHVFLAASHLLIYLL